MEMSQPLEIEQKFRVATHILLRSKLPSMGAVELPEEQHCDTYLQHPCRDFGQSGEAFRLREINQRAVVTYKGPRQPGVVKIRPEIEIPLVDGSREDWLGIWLALGFKVVAQVRKMRKTYAINWDNINLHVTLDEVERLGKFVEIEGLVGEQVEVEPVQRAILRLAQDLGLEEAESRSYLRQLMELG